MKNTFSNLSKDSLYSIIKKWGIRALIYIPLLSISFCTGYNKLHERFRANISLCTESKAINFDLTSEEILKLNNCLDTHSNLLLRLKTGTNILLQFQNPTIQPEFVGTWLITKNNEVFALTIEPNGHFQVGPAKKHKIDGDFINLNQAIIKESDIIKGFWSASNPNKIAWFSWQEPWLVDVTKVKWENPDEMHIQEQDKSISIFKRIVQNRGDNIDAQLEYENKMPTNTNAGDNAFAMKWDQFIQWDSRPGEHSAPKLKLKIRTTDKCKNKENSCGFDSIESNPESISLFVKYPTSTVFAKSITTPDFCIDNSKLFGNCQLGTGRITLYRDIPDYRSGEATAYRALISEKILENDKSNETLTLEFWTKRNSATGQRNFIGWHCSTNTPINKHSFLTLPETPSADELMTGCTSPANADSDPDLQKQRVYFNCNSKNYCIVSFLFHGRLAEIAYANFSENIIGFYSNKLTIAAWETLNRMYSESFYAPTLQSRIDEAMAQSQVCQNISREMKIWKKKYDEIHAHFSIEIYGLIQSCRSAQIIAKQVSEVAPIEAIKIYENLGISYLQNIGCKEPENITTVHDHWISLLKANGKDETPELARIYNQFLILSKRDCNNSYLKTADYSLKFNSLIEKLKPKLSPDELKALLHPADLAEEEKTN